MNSFSPFFNSAAPAAAKAPSDPRIANPGGRRELIMIVDDEDFVALLAERALTAEGYRVIIARDGFQALDIFKKLQGQIQLVILDFLMPIRNGAEVVNDLRRIDPRVPIVLTSGATSHESLKRLLGNGMCGFIPKPLARRKLLASVRSTLDAARNASSSDIRPADISGSRYSSGWSGRRAADGVDFQTGAFAPG
jgi:DNA-binding response OmpR family regulator